MLCFSPVSLREARPDNQPALIGQLKHAWPTTAINNTAAVLNQFSSARVAAMHLLSNVRDGDAEWCHNVTAVKAGPMVSISIAVFSVVESNFCCSVLFCKIFNMHNFEGREKKNLKKHCRSPVGISENVTLRRLQTKYWSCTHDLCAWWANVYPWGSFF